MCWMRWNDKLEIKSYRVLQLLLWNFIAQKLKSWCHMGWTDFFFSKVNPALSLGASPPVGWWNHIPIKRAISWWITVDTFFFSLLALSFPLSACVGPATTFTLISFSCSHSCLLSVSWILEIYCCRVKEYQACVHTFIVSLPASLKPGLMVNLDTKRKSFYCPGWYRQVWEWQTPRLISCSCKLHLTWFGDAVRPDNLVDM